MEWKYFLIVLSVFLTEGEAFAIESLEDFQTAFRIRRAAAPRSYMHAEECKGVNRTFPLMDAYPFCQSFVVCDPAGHKYIYDCPSGLWFNETSLECDYPENLEPAFQEECGELISKFEIDFFTKMSNKMKSKPGLIQNQEGVEFQNVPLRDRQEQMKNIKLQQLNQNQQGYIENPIIPKRRVKPQQAQIPKSDYPEANGNVETLSVNSIRRTKPHPASITHFSKNDPDEYYDEPQEPEKSPPKSQPSMVPFAQKMTKATASNSKNPIPFQDAAPTLLKSSEYNGYDYYDGVMPNIESQRVPTKIVQGPSLAEQQSLTQQLGPQSQLLLGQHPSMQLQPFLPQVQPMEKQMPSKLQPPLALTPGQKQVPARKQPPMQLPQEPYQSQRLQPQSIDYFNH